MTSFKKQSIIIIAVCVFTWACALTLMAVIINELLKEPTWQIIIIR